MNIDKTWWKEGVVYQIYCRSFKDTTGDGYGDIKGIIEKIPYLKELGITIVWLNPIYSTSDADNGYDIMDYQEINPKFGTMKDFDELLFKMHEAGIKVVMDLVVNHSSNQHQWFIESKKGNNEKKDWYIWSKKPNNWRSFFSGSAWKYDEERKEYYLHLFLEEQPDLNWENIEVRQSIYKMMKWWFDKGIDGFRMDVINLISKVKGFPNDSPVGLDGLASGFRYFANGPKVHEFLNEMNKEVLSHYDCLTVGETPGVTPEQAQQYVGKERHELEMLFQFEHVSIGYKNGDKWISVPWKLTELKKNIEKWQVTLHNCGWNSLYFNNHDQPRQVSRWGNDTKYRIESAKMIATLLHTLEGTPYIYQGEELGMTNVYFDKLDDYQDCEIFGKWKELTQTHEMTLDQFLKRVSEVGRDNARTPMQWDDSENAGFTSGNPWLKINPNYKTINAKEAMQNPNSVFNYYKQLLKLRKENPIMPYGEVQMILKDDEHIFAYIKTLNQLKWIVILNFFETPIEFILPIDIQIQNKHLIISNYQVDNQEPINQFLLKPYEARVYQFN
ncbi:hypothetical protein ENUP19_0201G0003 [Entamoeba nuttalli]|uniref:Oligo-1,6-glucosidase, putative n=2 Tax=Entamoeba nuttalli TaxID=412467 RepID=K2H3I9_ENTNP|nr:oligo-1,6-glucosidase, putative [Entamoeba nuttalli P19]EKE40927.1 oligo-1,6-glucosidase, putative [Entamoeba nuttalli P19]|eukprot:XP_008856738.1 oligo-1,6-glucosidase, putative [Entamoeba nuttalli P19]